MKYEDEITWLEGKDRSSEDRKKRRLVIFVHGLFGSSKTWVREDGQPKELISYVFKDSDLNDEYDRVFYSNYSTHISIPKFIRLILYRTHADTRINNSIAEIAGVLHSQIEQNFRDYKSITLITHSIGGLVAQWTILDFLKNPKEKFNINYLITLATPHEGSTLANIFHIFLRNKQIRDLQPSSDFIHLLTQNWVNYKEKLPYRCYCVGKSDDVVSGYSACGIILDNEDIVDYSKNHSTILHPNSKDDIIVTTIKNKLRDALLEQNKILSSIPENIISNLKSGELLNYINNLVLYLKANDSKSSIITLAKQIESEITRLKYVSPIYPLKAIEIGNDILKDLEIQNFVDRDIYESLLAITNEKIKIL